MIPAGISLTIAPRILLGIPSRILAGIPPAMHDEISQTFSFGIPSGIHAEMPREIPTVLSRMRCEADNAQFSP